jgi:hypothetical protein
MILPLSQLQFESVFFDGSGWHDFIEDERTRKEAVDILKFYIYGILEPNERNLNDLVAEYLKRYSGPWAGLQKLPAEIEKAMDPDELFDLIMRRVHFALVFLASDNTSTETCFQRYNLFSHLYRAGWNSARCGCKG